METFELLDRFELLYPTNSKLSDLRRAYIDQDISSIFRLLPNHVSGDIEELRKAVLEQNLYSIFRLVDDEDLRKLVLEDNTWKLWPILDRYVNTQFTAAFKNFFVNETEIWNDCFSRGQLQSKLWLIQELKKCNVELGTVFLCAGWYATLSVMLFESNLSVDKIRSFDIDPSCADIAETFNKKWLLEDCKFKASTVDIMDFEWSDHPAPSDGTIGNFYYMTEFNGKQVQMKDCPDTIINTSSEHIENFDEWYNNIQDGKLIILQNNNFVDIDEHVNSFKTLKQFSKSVSMKETLYEGELSLPRYKRFMKIGYK